MEMTDNNLCNSCTNIGCEFQSGIVRTKCAFYMPPHIEPDNCGNYVAMQPTVEAIPKADYENRLKVDMVAMLKELQAEIDEESWTIEWPDGITERKVEMESVSKVIQQKIDKLKGENNG